MVNSLFDITGKKAIVTGGTRGLGKGMAEGLMESGAEVAIIGTSDKVYQVADEFKARGFVCYGVKADLSDRDQCNEAFNKCVELLGDLCGQQRLAPSAPAAALEDLQKPDGPLGMLPHKGAEAPVLKAAEQESFTSFMNKSGYGIDVRGSEALMTMLNEQNDLYSGVVGLLG